MIKPNILVFKMDSSSDFQYFYKWMYTNCDKTDEYKIYFATFQFKLWNFFLQFSDSCEQNSISMFEYMLKMVE